MTTLSYNRLDLIKRLKQAREQKRASFIRDLEKALADQRKSMVKGLEAGQKALADWDAGKRSDRIYINGHYYYPHATRADTSDYDSQIARLEMASDEIVKLQDKQADSLFKLLHL